MTVAAATCPVRVGVIIVSWNCAPLLRRCLHSLALERERVPMDVIVVDNASSDGTIEMMSEDYPWVSVVASQRNLGFAAANIIGVRATSADTIVLLNPDTEVTKGAIAELVGALERHKGFAVLGPRLLNQDGSPQPSVFTFSSPINDLLAWVRSLRRGTAKRLTCGGGSPVEVEAVSGASMAVRSRALDECGFMDASFFMYSEEADLCFRLRQLGWAIGHYDGAPVVHVGGGSAASARSRTYVEHRLSRVRFVHKHHGRLAAVMSAFYVIAGMGLRACLHRSVWQLRALAAFLRALWQVRRGRWS